MKIFLPKNIIIFSAPQGLSLIFHSTLTWLILNPKYRVVGQKFQERTHESCETRWSCWEIRRSIRPNRRRRDSDGQMVMSIVWSKWDRGCGDQIWGNWVKESRIKSRLPCTMKPMITSVDRLTSHDTNNPPGMIVWLLFFQQSISPPSITGHHLMRIESDGNWGSVVDETWEESTTKEIGANPPIKAYEKSG